MDEIQTIRRKVESGQVSVLQALKESLEWRDLSQTNWERWNEHFAQWLMPLVVVELEKFQPPPPKMIDQSSFASSGLGNSFANDHVLKVRHAATDTQAGAAPNPAISGSVGSQSDSSNR